MTDRETSAVNATTAPEGVADDFGWSIFVVHHDEHPLSTIRRTLGRSQAVTFARGGGSFGDIPLDARLSRRHARFLVDGIGALYVVDEGSRNGVHRMGERVTHAALVAGDVLRIGGFLIVVQPTPLRFDVSDDPRLPLPGAATGHLVRDLRAYAQSGSPHIILLGETGCFVDAAAQVWAEAAGLPLEASSVTLDSGALFIPAVHRCPEARLARVLASGRRVIFDATGAPSGWSRPAALAQVPSVPLASLRARREDIIATIGARWRSSGVDRALTGAQAMTLLLASWPENEAQLHCVADALARGLDDGELSALLARNTKHSLPADGCALVAPDGTRFRTTAGELVDLRQRPVLARILHALAAADGPRSVDDLIAAAWPGASLVGDSGSARVYAAVATLRRFGLRDALVREGEGYRLDPTVARVDPEVHSIS